MTQVSWEGESGDTYSYAVVAIEDGPPNNAKGNYIFAREVWNGYEAVYVGEGSLRDRYNAALEDGCVEDKGATHYHYHPNAYEDGRKMEEQDIILGNPECLTSDGCNEIVA